VLCEFDRRRGGDSSAAETRIATARTVFERILYACARLRAESYGYGRRRDCLMKEYDSEIEVDLSDRVLKRSGRSAGTTPDARFAPVFYSLEWRKHSLRVFCSARLRSRYRRTAGRTSQRSSGATDCGSCPLFACFGLAAKADACSRGPSTRTSDTQWLLERRICAGGVLAASPRRVARSRGSSTVVLVARLARRCVWCGSLRALARARLLPRLDDTGAARSYLR